MAIWYHVNVIRWLRWLGVSVIKDKMKVDGEGDTWWCGSDRWERSITDEEAAISIASHAMRKGPRAQRARKNNGIFLFLIKFNFAYCSELNSKNIMYKKVKHSGMTGVNIAENVPAVVLFTRTSNDVTVTRYLQAHWATLYEASAPTVDSHTSLCVHSQPAIKERNTLLISDE